MWLKARNLVVSNAQEAKLFQCSAHEPKSDLLDTVTGPVHLVDNTWEPNRDVLDIKENRVASTIISRYDYSVNAIGQRTALAQTGTAFTGPSSIAWNYDSLGQVTQADHSSNIADRSYQYDAIGNRKKSATSLTLPATDNHTANALNQYTTVPGHPGAIVHDPDGNLTQGSTPATSNLVWDAENRLIAATNNASGVTTTYRYDAFSRRISRSVGILPTTLFIHDAWNCVAEYVSPNPSTAPILQINYLWGMDLSDTMQGAGGVGGLLSQRATNGAPSVIHYPCYDGNGNVTQYLTNTGAIATSFEYDPFGRLMINNPTNQFAYRFSTKPLDQPTGLYYYGYRYYDPATGRWPSRDPIGEEGGVNLYGFVGNDPINFIDYIGLQITVTPQNGPTNPRRDSQTGRYASKKDLIDQVSKNLEAKPEGPGQKPKIDTKIAKAIANVLGKTADQVSNVNDIFDYLSALTAAAAAKKVMDTHAKYIECLCQAEGNGISECDHIRKAMEAMVNISEGIAEGLR